MPTRSDVALAPRTTLGLGGVARRLVEAASDAEAIAAVEAADAAHEPVLVLGGGSNLVIADAGWPGVVVQLATRGIACVRTEGGVIVDVAAGEDFDALVAWSIASGLAGLECLSGIPGRAGAAPVQNISAYGQDIAARTVAVRVFDRVARQALALPAASCAFGYRQSLLRGQTRYLVLGITLRLVERDEAESIRYAELARALGASAGVPLGRVREAVLALRRSKGMVVDPTDPDSRSVGSFFINPLLEPALYARLAERAERAGVVAPGERVPCFIEADGRCKVPAGWLIERLGLRGLRQGAVGVSPKHALALVHYGGGSTAELLDLARHVRDTVEARLGLRLLPEPALAGVQLSRE